MKTRWLVLAFCAALVGVPARAQKEEGKEVTKEDPEHKELRKLKDELKTAFDKGDVDGMLSHLMVNVVVTWQNGEVSVGHDAVRKYYERMMKGPDSVVKEVKTKPEVKQISFLYNDKKTAVAYGDLNDHYTLRDGTDFAMNSVFSATAVKDNDRWKIASYHASTNVFDNQYLNTYVRRMAWWIGGIFAGILVLVILVFVVLLRRARRSAAKA